MPVPPLLFDLDGTLVDSLPDIAASVCFVRTRYGLPPLPLDAVRPMVGDGLTALLARALPGLDPGCLTAAEALYREHHRDQCTRLVRPFPGVHDHLQRWQAEGWPMAVVTNKPVEFARRVLAAAGIEGFFGAVVGGDSATARKPDPAPCRQALAALPRAAGGGTMIGDGVQDLRAGRAAGLRTIAALFGYGPAAELRGEHPDACWVAFGVAEVHQPA